MISDGGLSHLLSVLTDEKAVKQRIEDLQSATKAHEDAVQKNQEIENHVLKARSELEASIRDFNSRIAEHQNQVAIDKSYIQDRKRELDRTIADIALRNQNLKDREEILKEKAIQLDEIHANLVNREVDISTRTKMVEGREQQVQQHAERNKALIDHLRQNGFINI